MTSVDEHQKNQNFVCVSWICRKAVRYNSSTGNFVLRNLELTLGTSSAQSLIVVADLTVVIIGQHQFILKSRSSRLLFLIGGYLSSIKETANLGLELALSPSNGLVWHVDSIAGISLVVAQTAKGL